MTKHWASKLPEWYAQAIQSVRKLRPTFSPMQFGQASSPEAKKIRVMLRKLDPEWRTNG